MLFDGVQSQMVDFNLEMSSSFSTFQLYAQHFDSIHKIIFQLHSRHFRLLHNEKKKLPTLFLNFTFLGRLSLILFYTLQHP